MATKTGAKTVTKTDSKSMAKRFPMTIPKSLFDSWQKNKRKNDAAKLMEICERSRPIIDRALNYGHVKDDELISTITNYFLLRVQNENRQCERLNATTVSE
jgi:hypothetical protein